MSQPLKNIKNSIDFGKTGTHLTDLVISTVIALCIVTFITYTTGFENISLSAESNSSFELLSILQSLDNYNLGLKPNESILMGCAFTIGVCLLILTVYSLLHLKISKKLDKTRDSKRQRYQDYFVGTITNNNSIVHLGKKKSSLNRENKKHLTRDDLTNINNRSILLKELKGMHALINGEEKQRLKELYYGLGFIDDLPTKFRSPDWVQRVEAIHEVKQFEVTQYYPSIFKLINDSNSTVKRNSILARIDLEDNPLDILDDLNSKLSIWEKHNITLALEKIPNHLLPKFHDFIKKYPKHHEFLSEMKTHFNQDTLKLSTNAKAKLHVV